MWKTVMSSDILNLQLITSPNVVVNCSTYEQACTLLDFMDSVGYRWASGDSLKLVRDYQCVDTCYRFNKGTGTTTYANKDYYLTDGTRKILEFCDVLKTSPKYLKRPKG